MKTQVSGQQIQTLECFATPVWSKNADNFTAINKELLDLIPVLVKENKEGVQYTNSGGWQSDKLDINRTPLFKELIAGFTREVGVTLNINADTRIILNNCWINVNRKDNYNRAHTHPNSMVSGCYYVQTPADCGDIVFSDPRVQASCVLLPVTENNKYTVQTARFHPQPGSIVMFPSWLSHYVENNNSEEERISVAFNMIFGD